MHATLCVALAHAQLGIGTTTPNSTLEVRGSIATSYRAFTTNTTVTATDNLLVFTGSGAATITLPSAIGCEGRAYMIKNASTTGPTPVLTIATALSQTVDGTGSWALSAANETITLVSNGTNWNIAAQSLPGGWGTTWTQNGNSVAATRSIGTINNFPLPFITNNAERMRIDGNGKVGIGTSTFNGTNPEKLLVDAGTTTSVNAIVAKGSIDSYLQLNIQNSSTGTSASSDIVATANNGSETTNYIDLGINGSNYSGGVMGGANDSYLYNLGQNLLVGTGTAAKSLIFMTGGTAQATNERMRIDGNGNVGIGNNNPTSTFAVSGSRAYAFTTKTTNYLATANDYCIICNNAGAITISLPAASSAAGRVYVIKKISGLLNNVVIDPNASETIDGTLTRTLSLQYESVVIQSDGNNWFVLSKL